MLWLGYDSIWTRHQHPNGTRVTFSVRLMFFIFHFVLVPLYVWCMFDDIRVYVARSYTYFPDSTFSLISPLTLSRTYSSIPPPLCLQFHYRPSHIVLHFSHHVLIRHQPNFLEISTTFVVPLIISFLILSSFVTSHIRQSTSHFCGI